MTADTIAKLTQVKAMKAETELKKEISMEQKSRNDYINENKKFYEFGQKWNDISGAVGLGIGAVGGGIIAGYNKYKYRHKKKRFLTFKNFFIN